MYRYGIVFRRGYKGVWICHDGVGLDPTAMDPRIQRPLRTTFSSSLQISAIQQTDGRSPKLSRNELGHTICEHLGRKTPSGGNGVESPRRVLGELEHLGVVPLSALHCSLGRGRQRPPERTKTAASDRAASCPARAAEHSGRDRAGAGRGMERMGPVLTSAGALHPFR